MIAPDALGAVGSVIPVAFPSLVLSLLFLLVLKFSRKLLVQNNPTGSDILSGPLFFFRRNFMRRLKRAFALSLAVLILP